MRSRKFAARPDPVPSVLGELAWPAYDRDIPMRDIVDVMLAIDAHAYSFEAGKRPSRA